MLLLSEDDARAFVAARCSGHAFAKLERLGIELRHANAHQNLIAASTVETMWLRHIADSAQLLDHVSRETELWADFGSGAGFPGLVVAIMRPNQEVRLIESRTLRVRWLADIVERLVIRNCRIIGQDARRVDTFPAGIISARAFAPLPKLIAMTARFSTSETRWVLPKGRSAAQDVAMLPKPVQTLFHVKQSVTDADAGLVVGKGRIEP